MLVLDTQQLDTANKSSELTEAAFIQIVCTKCKQSKPQSYFSPQKQKLNGRASQCKSCSSEYHKKRYLLKKDDIIAYQKRYYKANFEYVTKRQKDYVERNKEKTIEYHKEYNIKNRGKLGKYIRDYYEQNKEKVLNKCKQYRELNKEEKSKRDSEYKKNNKEVVKNHHHKRRANKAKAGGSFTKQEILNMMCVQQSKCNICNCDISKKYHIDHIRPISKGGNNFITNIQLLCPPCNLKKGDKWDG